MELRGRVIVKTLKVITHSYTIIFSLPATRVCLNYESRYLYDTNLCVRLSKGVIFIFFGISKTKTDAKRKAMTYL